MPINFPNTPATNDVYLAPNGIEYIYTGSKWTPFKPVEPTIGTITASSQLNLSAGGSNQNVVISPSGSGNIQLDGPVNGLHVEGSIGIGISTPEAPIHIYSPTNASIFAASDGTVNVLLARLSNDSTPAEINFWKARNAAGTPISPNNNDALGSLIFSAYDTATFLPTSEIRGIARTVTGVDNISGAITFSTRPTGTTSNLTERVRIDDNGRVGIGNTAPDHLLSVNGTSFFSANTVVSGGLLIALGPGDQFSPAIAVGASAHPTSQRAAISLGDWQTGQDLQANGTLDYYIFGGNAGIAQLTISPNGNVTLANPAFISNATSGAGAIPAEQTFRLIANGGAIAADANFFGATSAVSLEAASMYEITYFCRILKTTSGTVTFTLTASNAPTQVSALYIQTPITGTGGVGVIGTITSSATAATAFAAAGSLTTGLQHFFEIRAFVLTNAACNFRLNLQSNTGSATPQAGSYYTVKKIPIFTGTFVA